MESGRRVAGRFEVERLVGVGGMGSVYRARDLANDGALVALKLARTAGPSEAARFAREARVLESLEHPAIVRYVAHGESAPGELYLAMEWLDGEDLSQRLASTGLTPIESLTVATRVAEALGSAHARGVVHRDVKPANLFLPAGRPDEVKLLDFGVARGAAVTQFATAVGAAVGTPGYMAPEQARGERAIDARADVFALGCVLFECVAGRPAFEGGSVMALLAKILLEDAPRLSDVCPSVSPVLDALVASMLSKDPAGRPRNGADAARALAAVGDPGGGARPTSGSPRAKALTAGELRFISVVLAAPSEATADQALEPTLASDAGRDATLIESVRTVCTALGAGVEWLAGGACVVTVSGAGIATDQAGRAAACALEVREKFPGARVVLATGRGAFAGRVPVGEVIDRASSLLPRAAVEAGASRREGRVASVCVDELTAGLLGPGFDVGPDAIGLPCLRGLASRGDDVPRTLLGRPSPFVGRERELRALLDTLAESVDEPCARAVVVTAPPGAGKSRLRHEFTRAARERIGADRVWYARAESVGAGSPFALVAGLVRNAATVPEGAVPSEVAACILACASRVVAPADAPRVAEFLTEIAGATVSAPGPALRAARGNAALMGDQVRRAWEDLLAAECRAGPLVLVMDDLQWGDVPSARMIDAALRNLADRPLTVLAFARPEVHESLPKLWADRGAQEVRLAPLGRRAAEALARDALGAAASEARVAEVAARSAGNAFYLEELIRAESEGRGGALPETVVAMAQARLEALDSDARLILRAASVLGETFWPGALRALLGDALSGARTSEWLARLGADELVAPRGGRRFAGEDSYVFRHALIREAAYATLTEHDRELGHRLAGEWLEAAGERDALVLAEHFERGGAGERAAQWYARSAEQALAGNDFVAVIARAERGVALGARGEAFFALRHAEAEAHRWRSEPREAQRQAGAAAGAVARGSAAWFRAAGLAMIAAGSAGDAPASEQWASEIVAAEGETDAAFDQSVALSRVGVMHSFAGRLALADEAIAASASAALRGGGARGIVAASLERARAERAVQGGDQIGAAVAFEAARAGAHAVDDLRTECNLSSIVGYMHSMLGDHARGEATLRVALATAERIGLEPVAAVARQNLGIVLLYGGATAARLKEGRALVKLSAMDRECIGDSRLAVGARTYWSLLEYAAGDFPAAEAQARAALELMEVAPTARPFAVAALAQALLAQGRTGEAVEWVRGAAAALEGGGSVEEGETLIRVTLARALYAAGDRTAALAALAVAVRRIEDLASAIADETARARFIADAPDHPEALALARAWGLR